MPQKPARDTVTTLDNDGNEANPTMGHASDNPTPALLVRGHTQNGLSDGFYSEFPSADHLKSLTGMNIDIEV